MEEDPEQSATSKRITLVPRTDNALSFQLDRTADMTSGIIAPHMTK